MRIEKNESRLTVYLEGRIDTQNAPAVSDEIENSIDGVNEVIYDCKDLIYISSSGLRIIMMSIKAMDKIRGEVRIINISEDIYELLETTGFTGSCDVEPAKTDAAVTDDALDDIMGGGAFNLALKLRWRQK